MRERKRAYWQKYADLLRSERPRSERHADLRAEEEELKREISRLKEREDASLLRAKLSVLKDVRHLFLKDELDEAENPYRFSPEAERLRGIDEEWHRRSAERQRKLRENYRPPWEETEETKEEWEDRKKREAEEVGRRSRNSSKKRWDKKSSDEKRRAIKLAAQFQKYNETKDEPLPQEGKNGVSGEWFEHIIIPSDIIIGDLWAGFDSELLIRRFETARSEFQSVLDMKGIGELRARKKDLEEQLRQRDQAFERNRQRSEEIIYSRYPEEKNSQFRGLDLFAVNSIAGAFFEPKDEAEEELARLSEQQQANIEDEHRLRFQLSVLVNVLERHRRGLPKSWETLYDRWKVDPEKLERLYAEAGVPLKGDLNDPYQTTLKLRDAYRERCKKVEQGEEKPFTLKKDLKAWALRDFGLSATELTRILSATDTDVWVKGKKGSPGAGLLETLANLKAYPDHHR